MGEFFLHLVAVDFIFLTKRGDQMLCVISLAVIAPLTQMKKIESDEKWICVNTFPRDNEFTYNLLNM